MNRASVGLVEVPAGPDAIFFAAVKPLVEGVCLMVETNTHQLVLQQVYLDLSLFKIHVHDCNGLSIESIDVEQIVKTTLPDATLELLQKQDKTSQRYKFSLIMEDHSMNMMALNYSDLKQWIVGINMLVQHKAQLTRLSSLVK